MALIKCPECGHGVSDTADICPECGYSISDFVHQTKIKQKRDLISSAPVRNNDWAITIEKKMELKKKVNTIISISFFAIGFIIMILASTGVLNPAANGFFGLFIFLGIIFIVMSAGKDCFLYQAEGSTLLFVKKMTKCLLYLNNVLVKDGVSNDIFTAKLPSGSIVTIRKVNNKYEWEFEDFSKFGTSPSNKGKVIVNNIVNNNITQVKKTKTERSDMEKILIKNAKIDALASIDPTDSERSKEQLEIVKKLDDLD